MSLENNFRPTEEQSQKHIDEINRDFKKLSIASEVGIVFWCIGLVFPPAMPGAIVCAAEAGRQSLKMNLKIIRFHEQHSPISGDEG